MAFVTKEPPQDISTLFFKNKDEYLYLVVKWSVYVGCNKFSAPIKLLLDGFSPLIGKP